MAVRRTGSSVLACLAVAWSSSATLSAQAAADPWSRVPPLTANCYRDDEFATKVGKLKESVEADLARQEETNAGLTRQMDQLPPMERQRRMQEYMEKDPQKAMKAMQAMQTGAQTANAGIMAAAAERGKLDEELTTHTTDFNAALKQAQDPVRAKLATLIETKSKVCGEGDCYTFPNPADKAQYESLRRQIDGEYDKVCPAWWGAKGTFPDWLGRYKATLVKQVASAGETDQAETALTMVGVNTAGYHSTEGLRAVRDYLGEVATAYSLRPAHEPAPNAGHGN